MADEDWDNPSSDTQKNSDANNNNGDAPKKTGFGFAAKTGFQQKSFGSTENNSGGSGFGAARTGFGSAGGASRGFNSGGASRGGFGSGTGGDRPKGCFNCNAADHMSRDCPEPKKERAPNKCFNCNAADHMSRDCPEPKKATKCFNCNAADHMSRDCPEPKKERTEGGGGFGRGGFSNRDNKEGGSSTGFGGFKARQDGDAATNGGEERKSGFGSRGGFGGFGKRDDAGGDDKPRGFGGFGASKDGGSDKPKGCFNCNAADHQSRDCPEPKKERAPTKCYNCNAADHMSRDCPEPKKATKCFNCGDADHMSRDCTKPKKEPEEGEKPREVYVPEYDNSEEAIFSTIATGVNFNKYASIEVTVTGENQDFKPLDKFADAKLSALLMKNIAKSKYEIPTPVQRYAIPILLQRRDIMACAQTGSGKTAAYLIPIMANILEDGLTPSGSFVQTPQALVLAPTRELAVQISQECRKFSYDSIIRSQVVYGGTSSSHQINMLERGVNILVATPGRLIDFINRGKISFEKLKYIVLDEADRMLDSGFEANIREILSKCPFPKGERNIFMFSATFPPEIQQLARDFLHEYLFIAVGVIGGANSDIDQSIIKVTKHEKRDKLLGILNEIGNERTMVFVEKKTDADVLAFLLIQKGYPTTSIHGDRLQSQRETALKDFKTGKCPVIVCTSVAARGLDIDHVGHVVNYDMPHTIDEYVHRIGRTGRCGNLGKAVSFFDTGSTNDKTLARSLIKILIAAGKEAPSWLEAVASDSVGTGFDDEKCTTDLRSGFKSLSVAAAAPAAGNDEETWD